MDAFNTLSILFLMLGLFSALLIIYDLRRASQSMWIMNVVWPLTALWSGLIGLWAYYRFGKNRMHEQMAGKEMPDMDMKMDSTTKMDSSMKMDMSPKPFWQKVALSTLHCGAGCTLADIIGEWAGFPFFFDSPNGIIGQWLLDYALALLIGVLFQYAAIRPMLQLSVGKTILRAFKIDFLSLTFWQIGMYSASYLLLIKLFRHTLTPYTESFWFIMQLAMFAGFLFSYPINWFLIRKKIKPSM